MGDDHILHLQVSLFDPELRLFYGPLLLGHVITELKLVERSQYLSLTNFLTVPDEHLFDGQCRLKCQVGITLCHHLTHGLHHPRLWQRQRQLLHRNGRSGICFWVHLSRLSAATGRQHCNSSYDHDHLSHILHFFIFTTVSVPSRRIVLFSPSVPQTYPPQLSCLCRGQ